MRALLGAASLRMGPGGLQALLPGLCSPEDACPRELGEPRPGSAESPWASAFPLGLHVPVVVVGGLLGSAPKAAGPCEEGRCPAVTAPAGTCYCDYL